MGLIGLLCYFLYANSSSTGGPFDVISKIISDYGPIVLVVAIIVYFVARRASGAAAAEGTESHASFNSVLFGNPPSSRRDVGGYEMVDMGRGDVEQQRYPAATAIEAPQRVYDGTTVPTAPLASKYRR